MWPIAAHAMASELVGVANGTVSTTVPGATTLSTVAGRDAAQGTVALANGASGSTDTTTIAASTNNLERLLRRRSRRGWCTRIPRIGLRKVLSHKRSKPMATMNDTGRMTKSAYRAGMVLSNRGRRARRAPGSGIGESQVPITRCPPSESTHATSAE